MNFNVEDLIQMGNFCTVSGEHLKDSDLEDGDFVFVAGHRALPISEDDPYTQRIIFMCHKSDDGGEIDMEAGFYLIDPNSLTKVDKSTQEKMQDKLDEQIQAHELLEAESPSESDH